MAGPTRLELATSCVKACSMFWNITECDSVAATLFFAAC